MFQTNMLHYASDALEDAMRLAQTKAINSYSFSDCLDFLNYAWMDMYQRIAEVDDGFYSRTVKLTSKLTKLPPCLKNTILVYAAQSPIGFNRRVFRQSAYNNLMSMCTYKISGFDLWCPDAERTTVWLNYIPMQPQLFFTRNNRDPKLLPEQEPESSFDYKFYTLQEREGRYFMVHKNPDAEIRELEITNFLFRGEDNPIVYISCDYPYIFVSYRNRWTGEYTSGLFKDIFNNQDFNEYNPFAYTGRTSNVEYRKCTWNDKTGMGVIVADHNDLDEEGNPRIKELGFTPDTLLNYPCPEMYRLLVAKLADKFSALNESNVMGVSKELTEAQYAFNAFCAKDKSAWSRMINITGPTIGDLL